MALTARSSLRPFSFVARFGFFLLAACALAAIGLLLFSDHADIAGLGRGGTVCISPDLQVAGTGLEDMPLLQHALKLGHTSPNARISMCAAAPTMAQRALSALAQLPVSLLYLAVFFLFARTVRAAEADGPFTPRVAGLLRAAGWTLLVGGYLAHAVQDTAGGALENTFAVRGDVFFHTTGDIVLGGVVTFPLWTLLAGLGLLTIARILKVGARMHDELAATI
ncbi:DUF2975 domain-containing protein [Actinomadura parmotrematis]|uniref:DUF2975 domain-containing protein n=1 Tax=Actinomadura parmotrematis TaxID=2864039 RepID=A0ABS7FTU4_9ACTN|nr:DUF2975 domain-containing protein [Actinomadura parmotrematis]MBW8483827.1 DUF2975 domain-containing protein [Actinomadura parmotrematis]